ncbi:MAG: restriction endonuclease subunit S, partial [Actinobacteria bacterium]|nr:restriction endonuclease subunit S [Actinomycetota bacterium]
IQIAEWIDHRVRAMDAQLGGLASQIELLREYRARLVADVVTGKLDVRAFAETLPDEAPDDIEAIEADVDEDADDDETGDGADEG